MTDETIIKYIKGELSPDEKKLFLDRVYESPENMEYYRNIRKLWDLSELTDCGGQSDSRKYNEINAKIYSRRKSRRINSYRRIYAEVMKVAVAAVVAFGIFRIAFGNQSRDEDVVQPVAYNNIEVPSGQRVKLSLSDGSTVWLNAGTKFTYPDRFPDSLRLVRLDGEAQFNIDKNENRSFVVQTSTHSIKVHGTKFNVYAYDESPVMEVTLLEGSVSLWKGDDSENPAMLEKGRQAVYDKNSGVFEIHDKVDANGVTAWVDGYFSFKKTPFREMAERLSHYYEKKITVKYPAILDYECTGRFRHHESLEHVLEVVKISKPFKYKITANEVIIY